MTTRRRSVKNQNTPMAEQQDTEITMINAPTQAELEEFFAEDESTPEVPEEYTYEPPREERKRVRPPKTGKVFLGEEDIRHFEAYKKFLKNQQGIKDIRHKPI